MDVFEKLLCDLAASVEDESAALDPETIIQNIDYQLTQSHFNDAELETILCYFFQSETPPCMIKFIVSTMKTKDKVLVKSKCQALKSLAGFVKTLGEEIATYITPLHLFVLDVLRREDSNEVKASALIFLRNLLRHVSADFTPEQLSLHEMYTTIIELLQVKKTPLGVKYHGFVVIGVYVSLFPNATETRHFITKITDLAAGIITETFGGKKVSPDVTLIAGVFSCIDRCLFDYDDRFSAALPVLWKALLMTMNTLNQGDQLNRYKVVSKALRLISHHAMLFRTLIANNIMQSHTILLACAQSGKSAVEKYAEDAYSSVLVEYAYYITERHESLDKTHFASVDAILQECVNRLESSTSRLDVLLSVRGISAIAPALQFSSSDLNNLLRLLIRSATQYSLMHSGAAGSLRIGQYLLAVAVVLGTSTCTFTEDVDRFITDAMLLLVTHHSALYTRQKVIVERAIIITLIALAQRDQLKYRSLLQALVSCLVIRSVSRAEPGEFVEILPINPATGESEFRLYASYVRLWKILLLPTDLYTVNLVVMICKETPVCKLQKYMSNVSSLVIAVLFTEILRILRSLDLEYSSVTLSTGQDVPLPSNVIDQEVLLNLTSTLTSLLPSLPMECDWDVPYDTLINIVVSMSLQYPLISPFYRLVTTVLAMVTRKTELSDASLQQVRLYFASVVRSMITFEDELQATALLMIFHAPKNCITLDDLAAAVCLALDGGVEVADAVAALSDWLITEGRLSSKCLDRVLPRLQNILSGGRTKKRIKGMKEELQVSVVRFLGQLGGDNKAILDQPQSILTKSIKWQFHHQITLPLSNEDGVNFPIEGFFCRLSELCMDPYPENRQLRLLSGECVHAMVRLVIGRAATDPRGNATKSYGKILNVMLPTLIRLAVGTEEASRSLFESLLLQLVRWASSAVHQGRGEVLSEAARCVVDATLEGLTGGQDAEETTAAVRNICGVCIVVILEHSNSKIYADTIFRMLFLLLQHPHELKRLGAVVGFLHLRNYISHNMELAKEYVLKVLRAMLAAIEISIESCQKECVACLQYYFTIAKEVYTDDTEAAPVIREYVSHLWKECSSPVGQYRRQCMSALLHLSGILHGVSPDESAVIAFNEQCDTSSVGTLLELLEKPLLQGTCVALALNGVLDAYNWLMCCFPGDVGERVILTLCGSTDDNAKGRSKKTKSTAAASYASGVIPQIIKLIDVVMQKSIAASPSLVAETLRRALQFIINVYRLSPNTEFLRPVSAPHVFPVFIPALCLGEVALGEGKDAAELIPTCCEEILRIFPALATAVMQKCSDAIKHFDASSDLALLQYVTRTVNMLKRLEKWSGKQASNMVARVVEHVSSVKPSAAGNIISYAVAMDIPLIPLGNEDGLVSMLLREGKWEMLGDAAEGLHRSMMATCDIHTFRSKFDSLFALSQSHESVAYNRLLCTCIEELLRNCENHLDKCRYVLATCENRIASCTMDVTILLLQLHTAAKARSTSLMTSFFNKCVAAPLTSNTASCFDICRSLRLLPYFMLGCVRGCPVLLEDGMMEDDYTAAIQSFDEKITNFLEEIVAAKFPLDSQALDPSTDMGKDFCSILRAWLDAFENCGSLSLLLQLVPTLREGTRHRYYHWFKEAVRVAIEAINYDVHATSLTACFGSLSVVGDQYQEPVVKEFFLDYCISTLEKCSPSSLCHLLLQSNTSGNYPAILFPQSKPSVLIRCLVDGINAVSDAMTNSLAVGEVVEHSVISTYCAYHLIRLAYDRCSVNDVKTVLTRGFVGEEVASSGKELTQAVCRIAHKQLRHPTFSSFLQRPENAATVLIRKLMTAAYSCLAVVVARTQSEEQFFDTFLFKEKAGESMWRSLVRISGDLSTESMFESVVLGPKPPAVGSSHRGAVLSQSLLGPSQHSVTQMMVATSPFLSGSNIANKPNMETTQQTSVAASVKAEFTQSMSGTQSFRATQSSGDMDSGYDVDNVDAGGLLAGWDDTQIALEMNHVNKSMLVVMGPLVRVLNRMSCLFSNQWKQKGIPTWLTTIITYLNTTDAGLRQTRLFMLQLLLNAPITALSKEWAGQLLGPVLDCCVRDLCAGSGIPYMLRDVILACCDAWSSVKPDDFSAGNAIDLISYLVQHSYVSDTGVCKENLNTLRALLQSWMKPDGPSLACWQRIDVACLLKMLSAEAAPTGGAKAAASSMGTEGVRQRLYSLDIVAMLVTGAIGLPGANIISGSLWNEICEKITDGIKYPRREVVERSASVTGKVLQYFSNVNDKRQVSIIQSAAVTRLQSVFVMKAGGNLVATCLCALAQDFPQFLTRELFLKVLTVFDNLDSRGKAETLEALQLSTCDFESISVVAFLKPYVLGLLADHTPLTSRTIADAERGLPMVPICTLRLMKRYAQQCIESGIMDQIVRNGHDVVNILLHPDTSAVIVRCETYDVLIAVHRLLTPNTPSLEKAVQSFVLRGLTDPDDGTAGNNGIRQRVFDYFDTKFGSDVHGLDRAVELFRILQVDDSGTDHWLRYSSYLLLHSYFNAPTCSASLFPAGLGDANYTALNVSDSKEITSSTRLPLFSIERTSQLMSSTAFTQAASQQWRSTQKGTQSQLESQSQYLSKVSPKFTSSTAKASALASTQHMSLGDIASSNTSNVATQFLFTGTSKAQMTLISQRVPIRFQTQSTETQSTGATEAPAATKLIPAAERTTSSAYANKRFHASTAMISQRKLQKTLRKQRKVFVMRNYRDGTYPDIAQLAPIDILQPLQRLCLYDATISKLIFVECFQTLYSSSKDENKLERVRDVLISIVNNVKDEGRTTSNSYIVSALAAVCLHCIRMESVAVPQVAVSQVLSPSSLAALASSSMNHHSAIHVLEEQIRLLVSRRNKDNVPIWQELTKLYRSLEDRDMVVGVLSQCSKRPDVTRALYAEWRGEYSTAIEIYNALLESDAHDAEADLWMERSMDCLVQLQEWGKLHTLATSTAEAATSPKVASHILLCHMHMDEQVNILEYVHQLTTDMKPSLKQWLDHHHSPEIASCYAALGEWVQCRQHIQLGYQSAIAKLMSLHPTAYEARSRVLASLQHIVELEQASDYRLNRGNIASEDQLLNRWRNMSPHHLDPLLIWSNVARSRELCLRDRLGAYTPQASEHLSSLHIFIALTAVKASQLSLVKAELAKAQMIRGKTARQSLTWTEVQTVFRYNMRNVEGTLAEMETTIGGVDAIPERITTIFNRTKALLEKKQSSDSEALSQIQCQLLLAELHMTWSEYSVKMAHIAPDVSREHNDKAGALFKELVPQVHECEPIVQCQVYSKYALFCDNLLSNGYDAATAILSIEMFFRGLLLLDATCKQHLVHILHLIGDVLRDASMRPAAKNQHIKQWIEWAEAVPAWIYIQHAPQIMGNLDKDEGVVAIAMLEKLALFYPTALYYPFTISHACLSDVGKGRCGRLLSILKNPILECFTEALHGLTHPEHRFSDALKNIKEHLKNNTATPQMLEEAIKEATSTVWPSVGGKIGLYNIAFSKKLARHLHSFKAKPQLANTLLEHSNYITNAAREMHFSGGKVPLNQFSQWLDEFDGLETRVEMPGQYWSCDDREPLTECHTKILSIDRELLVMSSIRKPKRICFHSSTGHSYYFLVKGGEDLRNDERVQQLFKLLNTIMQQEQTTLAARVYSVIPMTLRVGVLEWVQNTAPLKSIITEEMALDNSFLAKNLDCIKNGEVQLQAISAGVDRDKWLNGIGLDAYHKMFKKASEANAVKLWKNITDKVPNDFLRRYMLRLATSPEVFLLLRSECAKSLAVSSIYGYLLGIGDRHLDNLLIGTDNGTILQIDFGICFGMGASVLPVPELIPFRLSPQLAGLFKPLNGSLIWRQYMISVMNILRQEKHRKRFKTSLDVYIDDPIVDWLKGAHKKESDTENVMWEPRRRVQSTLNKLEGVSPADILIDDLSRNAAVLQFQSLDALTAIISKCKDPSRARKLEVPAQIDELMNIATDPNILVRQYAGLNIWI